MRKRDCIEFLWDRLKPFLPKNYTVDESIEILFILEQAKAMHKEDIKKAWDNAAIDATYGNKFINFEQYYNETFGGQQ